MSNTSKSEGYVFDCEQQHMRVIQKVYLEYEFKHSTWKAVFTRVLGKIEERVITTYSSTKIDDYPK